MAKTESLVELFIRRTYASGKAIEIMGKKLSLEEALDYVKNYPDKRWAIPPMDWVRT